MARTDRQLDTERPDRSDERNRARKKGHKKAEDLKTARDQEKTK